jgi:threonine 3-dehydrogenase
MLSAIGGKKIFVIGAAGAIGKQLVLSLVKRNGPQSVVAALHRSPLPADISEFVLSEFDFDIQNPESIHRALSAHKDEIYAVWNLAAPLSVDTAKDPEAAERITVGGMRNLLNAMKDLGLNRIFFSDSIGSFGRSSPREGVSANWLVSHPEQDPGSDYGAQKRRCRELMTEYSENHGFDSRFVIIPGVLHGDKVWSGGTTEYALDAIWAAHQGEHYTCPVPADVKLPMIFIDDLTSGMTAISVADGESLTEPQRGYCLAGFSFSPTQLFTEIQKHIPGFTYSFDSSMNVHMAAFAETWPDSLSGLESERDFGFKATMGIEDTVAMVLKFHSDRAKASA